MSLIEDVLDHMEELAWFTTLDFQFRFWQIPMAPKNILKNAIITKSRFSMWNVMPFGLKNTTSTFSKMMVEVFKDWNNWFLNFFVNDVNIHNLN
jgi:hypothetical protein